MFAATVRERVSMRVGPTVTGVAVRAGRCLAFDRDESSTGAEDSDGLSESGVEVEAILIQELRPVPLVRPQQNSMDVGLGHHDREAIPTEPRHISDALDETKV